MYPICTVLYRRGQPAAAPPLPPPVSQAQYSLANRRWVKATHAWKVRKAKICGTSLCSVPRRRGTGGVRWMTGTDIISVQFRDTCAYDAPFDFNRILPNLNSLYSTQQRQLKVVNRPSSFRFRLVHGDFGMSSWIFVYRHIYFGQVSLCTERILEELLISFGGQFFVSNLDKI